MQILVQIDDTAKFSFLVLLDDVGGILLIFFYGLMLIEIQIGFQLFKKSAVAFACSY